MEKLIIEEIEKEEIDNVASYLVIQSAGAYDKASWIRILEKIWVHNPFLQYGKPLGWKIIDEEKKIRGVLGSIQVQVQVQGVVKDSFWATSWFVDEAARSLSLQLFLLYVKQGGLLMSNTPNENVEKLLVRLLKYKRAVSPWFSGSYMLPVKPLAGFLYSGKTSAISVRKTAVFISAILLKIPQAIHFLRIRSGKVYNEIIIKQVQQFSENTDAWFEEFSHWQACSLRRSAQMYQWLFADRAFRVFEVSYQNKIQGYLVSKTKQNKDFSYIELIDEALLPLPEQVQKVILQKTCYTIMQSATAESLLVMRSNSESARQCLKSMWAIPVKKVEKTYYKENFLASGETPFLTSLDGDSIFF